MSVAPLSEHGTIEKSVSGSVVVVVVVVVVGGGGVGGVYNCWWCCRVLVGGVLQLQVVIQ